MIHKIDLNCDLGEGVGYDHQIMPFISSCNIACGGHFGTLDTVQKALESALKFNVKPGAHPSFEDKENFGRVRLEWSRSRFRESVTHQLQSYKEAAAATGSKLNHIKMHGALYHATAHDVDFATWTIELLQEFYTKTPIYSLPNSILHKICLENNLPFIAEAFADRTYKPDGSLVSRSQSGAVITDVKQVANQLIQMVQNQMVITHDGPSIKMKADTYCIHGDNLALLKKLPELIQLLREKNINIG
jgi:UPF0271 protein